MKHFFPLLTAILLPFHLLVAQQVSYEITFGKPQIVTLENGYQEVRMDRCFIVAEEGFPALPVYSADILLPPGKEILSAEVTRVGYSEFIEEVNVNPSPGEFPISTGAPRDYKVRPRQEIYGSSSPYPGKITGSYATHFLSGHSIGTVALHPVEFTPAEARIRYVKSMTLTLTLSDTERAGRALSLLRNSPATERKIRRLAMNPEASKSYAYPAGRTYPAHDILLISNQALLPHFDSYIAFKESTGYLVKTVTTEYILSNFTGVDDQEKIRNCIIDSYANDGIEAVILGGDADPANASERVIPHRGMYVAMGSYTDTDIPADLYYSNLDGTWNDDGDNRWGEPGEEDLYSEVSVGRICVDDATEILNMTNKLTAYQDAPVVSDIEKALMIGESLDATTWGGNSKDEIANGSSNNGFTTAGIPGNFNISYLYERDGDWNRYDVFDQFNLTGVNLLNHLGHSNVYYNMKMNTSQFSSATFTNDGVSRGYVIGYSQGCYNGSFDNRGTGGSHGSEDCHSEKMTTISTAEVACVTNSRYGWYQPGGTNASSQYFDRQFFDALFGEEITAIGWTNADSKEDNASFILSSNSWRWCCYELNLFGDPTMDIWTAVPTAIAATHPSAISVGATSFFVQTDAAGARMALVQDGTVLGRGLADANGTLDIQLFDPLVSTSDVSLSIIAHNRIRYQETLAVISDQPYVVYEMFHVDDSSTGNNNGLCDYGETVFLSLDMVNIGMSDATDVTVSIHSDDPHITLIDSTESYGYIGEGDTVTMVNGFSLSVCDFVPDNYTTVITVEAVSESTWTSYFNISFCAPELVLGTLTVLDTIVGDGDGFLEPGETADILINSANFGNSDAFSATGIFSTYNGLVTILNGTYSADTVYAGGAVDAVYRISVDAISPEGMNIEFENEFTAGNYACQKTYYIKVGMIYEDWESNTFNRFEWEQGGDVPWLLTPNNVYEGSFSACSGSVNDEESSDLSLTMQVTTSDSIRFYRKVSSEAAYDWLKFYIDDEVAGQWSGEVPWGEVVFPVTAGDHTFRWSYEKDEGVSAGSDRAWIDFIVFPYGLISTCQAGADQEICENENAQLDGYAYYYEYLAWSTTGTGTFSDTFNLEATYTPGAEDITSGQVTLTLTATNFEGGVVSDDMILSFDYLPGDASMPAGPDYIDLYLATSSDYEAAVVTDATNYLWYLDPPEAGTLLPDSLYATVEWDEAWMGTAALSVQGINECGEGTVSEPLLITVDNTVGLPETPGQSLSIYPNPASDKLFITFRSTRENWHFHLYDLMGETVVSAVMENTSSPAAIDISHVSPGVYFAVVSDGMERHTVKVVVR